MIIWVRTEESILSVDALELLAPLGVRVESHISHGDCAVQFHDPTSVSVTLTSEDISIWRIALETVAEDPKSCRLHDPTLLPQIAVEWSCLMVRADFDCRDIAELIAEINFISDSLNFLGWGLFIAEIALAKLETVSCPSAGQKSDDCFVVRWFGKLPDGWFPCVECHPTSIAAGKSCS